MSRATRSHAAGPPGARGAEGAGDLCCASGIRFEDTALARFLDDYGYVDLAELHAVAAEEPERFWAEVEDALGVRWATRYRQVVDVPDDAGTPRWFVGGRLDLYDQLVGRGVRDAPERNALVWEGDDGATGELSWAELDDEARRLAAGLAELGVGQGDRVAINLPQVLEAVVVLLATLRLGAVAVPLSPGCPPEVVASRLADSGARVLVCIDGYLRRGERIDMLAGAREAAAQCPALVCLVVVPRLGGTAPPEPIVGGWRERDYRILVAQAEQHADPAVFDADTPLMILYTSTAKGGPRALVHTHAGFPLKAAQDMLMTFDVNPQDRLMWVADGGGMPAPWLVFGGLLRGATIVLFEGVPDHPSPDRLWRLAARHRLTHVGLSPALACRLMAAGDAGLPQPAALDSVRVFGASGQRWDEHAWRWLFRDVGGERRPIISYCGGVAVGGAVLGCFPGLPQKPCGFAGPVPGMAADLVDAGGRSLLSPRPGLAETGSPRGGASGCGAGELVLRAPSPGMARGFWHDDERELIARRTRFPGVWVQGDRARVDADGHWFVHGRSDDTPGVAGRRIGPAEYELALSAHPLVGDAVAIGIPDAPDADAIVCFVTVAAGVRLRPTPSDAVRELAAHVSSQLGGRFAPARIHLAAALPAVTNAALRRRLVRAAYLGEALDGVAAAGRLAALDAIRACRATRPEA